MEISGYDNLMIIKNSKYLHLFYIYFSIYLLHGSKPHFWGVTNEAFILQIHIEKYKGTVTRFVVWRKWLDKSPVSWLIMPEKIKYLC